MSPIIKLNIIEYLFLLYIHKQLQKKSIKKRNFIFAGQIDPPLDSWRYGKPLGSLRVKLACEYIRTKLHASKSGSIFLILNIQNTKYPLILGCNTKLGKWV